MMMIYLSSPLSYDSPYQACFSFYFSSAYSSILCGIYPTTRELNLSQREHIIDLFGTGAKVPYLHS